MTRQEVRNQRIGALKAALFGLVVLLVGLRLVVYSSLLADPSRAIGVVTETGTTQGTSGRRASYIRYQFVDAAGVQRAGTSTGYASPAGESVAIEYATDYAWIHRVAGEGRQTGYEWRWYISAFGAFFLIAGIHWSWHAPRMPD